MILTEDLYGRPDEEPTRKSVQMLFEDSSNERAQAIGHGM